MCCCISIEASGLMIAVIDMALNLIGVFFSIIILIYQVCFQMKCHIQITDAISKWFQRHYPTEEDILATMESIFWSLILFIVLCIKQIIFNSVLIHGIRKNDIHKVKTWLAFKACIVVLGIFMILTQNTAGQAAYRQISEILYVFLTLFFMCIIFILYDVMHKRRHRVTSNRLVTTY